MKNTFDKLTQEQKTLLRGAVGEGLWDHMTSEDHLPPAIKELIAIRLEIAGVKVPGTEISRKAIPMKTFREDHPLTLLFDEQMINKDE